MRGMNRNTGKWLDGVDHLEQRLQDVLTTLVGSRVMERDYGAALSDLQSGNMNENWIVKAYSIIAQAVENPVNGLNRDFRLVSAKLESITESGASFSLTGDYTPTRQRVKIPNVRLMF